MEILELERFRSFDPVSVSRNVLFGTTQVGCEVCCLEPGQQCPAERLGGAEEVWVVLEGEGTFGVDGQEEAIEAGHAVHVGEGSMRGLTNEGPDRLVCLLFRTSAPESPRSEHE